MRRYNGNGYMALLKRRRRLKKSGKTQSSAYRKLGQQASTYRKRMINKGRSTRRNRVESFRRKTPAKCAVMTPESKKLYEKLLKHPDGKKVDALWRKFWMLNCPPPSLETRDDGSKKITPLVGIGRTNVAFISNGQKGEHGKKTRTVKGEWLGATEQSGKHVLLLTRRPISGKFKFVGYAPRTDYVPPDDIEKLGTPKAGSHWKHLHGEKDGLNIPNNELEWPRVYADRNGQVDGDSNFIYDKTKHGKITNWMYG